jgi:hypothetical protein
MLLKSGSCVIIPDKHKQFAFEILKDQNSNVAKKLRDETMMQAIVGGWTELVMHLLKIYPDTANASGSIPSKIFTLYYEHVVEKYRPLLKHKWI